MNKLNSAGRRGAEMARKRLSALEERKALLIESRKMELGEIIAKAGGLGIDNRLLTGFARFTGCRENKEHDFLKEMLERGKNCSPPSGQRGSEGFKKTNRIGGIS